MKIIVGSENKTKLAAVETVFPNMSVITHKVPSDVSAQPMTDEETRQGAVNRARYAQATIPGSIGIGLEGGIMDLEGEVFLCNWGALVTAEQEVITAAGARIKLPNSFHAALAKGKELSDIMEEFTQKADIRNKEGAIGIFTNNEVTRTALFIHLVTLLKGQYAYNFEH